MRAAALLALVVHAGLAGSGLSACSSPEPPPRRPEPAVEIVPLPPEPMECRFDPVTRADEPTRSGLDMCYTAGEKDPWWVRLSAPVPESDAAAPPLVADASVSPSAEACPPDMVLVEGMYCPDARHRCLRYLDDMDPAGFLRHHRCAEYDKKVECLRAREHRRFCIDRDEYVAKGAELPLVEQSWTTAKDLCESLGKRLCFESEWQFACEGEAILPYPYGFSREAKRCNHDLSDLAVRGKLRDQRVHPSDRPTCTSPFGARNMVGNVDEWTYRDGMAKPWRASLRGGWWLAGRNNCRAATTGHDEYYFGAQTGVRCCENAR
jgi:hypothetical protein